MIASKFLAAEITRRIYGYSRTEGLTMWSLSLPQVAATLARLCSYTPDPRAWHLGHCPQGAHTSPAISNLVCRRLDARLEGLARRNEGVFTRYADDLAFSFKDKALDLGRFRWWVDQVCHQEGFFINQKKFRVIRASQRQLVTGIVVNDELRVPREARRRFRATLHNCRKHGLEPHVGGGKLVVSAGRDGDALVITVRDTGVGMSDLPVDGIRFGLRQVRERLAALHGGQARLELVPAHDAEGGTLATVRLPLH